MVSNLTSRVAIAFRHARERLTTKSRVQPIVPAAGTRFPIVLFGLVVTEAWTTQDKAGCPPARVDVP
jgi:hypothetical protein